jgi:hypothetical protein
MWEVHFAHVGRRKLVIWAPELSSSVVRLDRETEADAEAGQLINIRNLDDLRLKTGVFTWLTQDVRQFPSALDGVPSSSKKVNFEVVGYATARRNLRALHVAGAPVSSCVKLCRGAEHVRFKLDRPFPLSRAPLQGAATRNSNSSDFVSYPYLSGSEPFLEIGLEVRGRQIVESFASGNIQDHGSRGRSRLLYKQTDNPLCP